MLEVLSLLGFFTVFFAIYAIRSIVDEKHKHNFKIYTILASICGGVSFWLILLGIMG